MLSQEGGLPGCRRCTVPDDAAPTAGTPESGGGCRHCDVALGARREVGEQQVPAAVLGGCQQPAMGLP